MNHAVIYDTVCILTSVAYTGAGLACILSGNWKFAWFAVMASGIASCSFRGYRLRSMLKSKCSLGYGHLCNKTASMAFWIDLGLALIMLFTLLFQAHEDILHAPSGICATLMLLSWSAWWVNNKQQKNNAHAFGATTCTLHGAAHIIGTATLWHTAIRLFLKTLGD